MTITSGIQPRPIRVVIYGPEGIGKTTLASAFPKPLFIDTEGGTANLDVHRTPRPVLWTQLLNFCDEIARDPGEYKTLVLDTADWAEKLCVTHICKKANKTSVEDFGYGKGYTILAEEFMNLIQRLDAVNAAGLNVVVVAHAKMRKQELPDEMGAFDRWELKLSKNTAPILKEWCDDLLFLNYKTYVVTSENGAKKAQGGKRVIYASHHPCWDAKNRHGLPDEMEMSFEALAPLFAAVGSDSTKVIPTPPKMPLEQLLELMERDGVTEDQLREIARKKGYEAADVPLAECPPTYIRKFFIPHWDKIVATIKN